MFDRTGALFVTTGDRNRLRDLVQQTDNHIGKIIRITDDGGIPEDNPKPEGWLPEIWSVGHRNIQGATLHPVTGELWTVEHGSRGGDELNRPQGGKNYGWPVISYGKEYSGDQIGEGTAKDGMEQPVHYWDPSIAPSGMVFYTGDKYPDWQGDLFVGALVQRHVARLTLEGGRVVSEERLFDGEARFRDVRQGPDGYLYLLTDEGAPDGRVLRVASAERERSRGRADLVGDLNDGRDAIHLRRRHIGIVGREEADAFLARRVDEDDLEILIEPPRGDFAHHRKRVQAGILDSDCETADRVLARQFNVADFRAIGILHLPCAEEAFQQRRVDAAQIKRLRRLRRRRAAQPEAGRK